MIAASEFAESLAGARRVLGWYHSHPQITVPPSRVDTATQATYQTMDQDFVGLIFSVFVWDKKTYTDHKEVIAFQTDSNGEKRYINLEVRHFNCRRSRRTMISPI